MGKSYNDGDYRLNLMAAKNSRALQRGVDNSRKPRFAFESKVRCLANQSLVTLKIGEGFSEGAAIHDGISDDIEIVGANLLTHVKAKILISTETLGGFPELNRGF